MRTLCTAMVIAGMLSLVFGAGGTATTAVLATDGARIAPPAQAARAPLPTDPPTAAIFDVDDFGAMGDGATNDSAAIQRALDAAADAGGGTVLLPAGIFMLGGAASLKYGPNVTITGAGQDATVVRNMTNRGAKHTVMLEPSGPGVHDATVQDITLDQRGDHYGDGDGQYLMSIQATRRVTVQDVTFTHVRTMAIWCDSDAAAPTVGHRVLRSHITDASGDGISYFGAFSDFVIDGNLIERTKDDAIAVQEHVATGADNYPTRIEITNNTVRDSVERNSSDSTPNGINVFGADRVTVADNTIDRTFSNTLRVGGGKRRRATNVTVTGNVLSGAGANNDTTDVPASGILIWHADHVWIARNVIAAGGNRRPISVEGSTDISVA